VPPLIENVPLVWIVTALVYQPFIPAVPAVTERATFVGAVLSYWNEALFTGELVFPALSVHVPWTEAVVEFGPL
jgi:hypothetical protein